MKLLEEYGKYEKKYNSGYGLKNLALKLLQQKRNMENELKQTKATSQNYRGKKLFLNRQILFDIRKIQSLPCTVVHSAVYQ